MLAYRESGVTYKDSRASCAGTLYPRTPAYWPWQALSIILLQTFRAFTARSLVNISDHMGAAGRRSCEEGQVVLPVEALPEARLNSAGLSSSSSVLPPTWGAAHQTLVRPPGKWEHSDIYLGEQACSTFAVWLWMSHPP